MPDTEDKLDVEEIAAELDVAQQHLPTERDTEREFDKRPLSQLEQDKATAHAVNILKDRETAVDGFGVQTVTGSQATTVEHYDIAVKTEAYDRFIRSDQTSDEISMQINVPVDTIRMWAKQGKWMRRKKAIEYEVQLQTDAKYRRLILANRIPVLQRHLDSSGELEEMLIKVMAVIKKELDSADDEHPIDVNKATMALKRLAESLAASTGVSARAVSVGEIDKYNGGGGSGKGSGPSVLIMPGIKPRVAVRDDDGNAIDIESEEVHSMDVQEGGNPTPSPHAFEEDN